MTKVAPKYDDVIERFPQFADADEEIVKQCIDLATTFVGNAWDDKDWRLGIMYFTAHLLDLMSEDVRNGTTSESSSSQNNDGAFVRSVSIGERRVTFATPAEVEGARFAGSTATDFELAKTSYGQMYLNLLRRNVPGVAVI